MTNVEFFWRFEPIAEISSSIAVRTIYHEGTNTYFFVRCSSTLGLYVGQPFSFSGALFGGVVPFAEYTVHSIISRSTFVVSVGANYADTFPVSNYGTGTTGLPAVPQLVVFAVIAGPPAKFICQ